MLRQCRRSLPLGDAARALGVSADTLRRWDRAGKLRTTRDERNRRRVPRAEVERLSRAPASATRTGDTLSARNRFPGVVRSVEVDGVMALVEIEAGPLLVTAAVTRDAVEELGLAPGVRGHRGGEGDLGDGAAAMRRVVGAVAACSRSPSCGCGDDDGERRPPEHAAPRGVGRRLADRGADRCSTEFAGADVRLSFAGSDELAAQIRQGVEARRLRRRQHAAARGARRRRACSATPVEFATNELVIAVPDGRRDRAVEDLTEAGVEDRDRRRVRAGRHLHPRGARPAAAPARARRSWPTCAPEEPDVKGDRRQAHAGRRRRRLRLPHRRQRADGKLQRDRAAAASCSPRWPTAPASSRARSSPSWRKQFVDGLHRRATCAEALREAGFGAAAVMARWFPARSRWRWRSRWRSSRCRCVAIFVDSQPGELVDGLGEPGALDALWLSLQTTRDRAGDHRRGRHAGRLPAGHAPLPRPRAGDHAGRAAAGAAARGGRASRCWPRSGP